MITVDTHTKVHSRSSSPAFGNAMLQAVPSSDVYLMDCIQGMKHYPDKWFDLAITDPPYGIDASNMNLGSGVGTASRTWSKKDWDLSVPQIEYFTAANGSRLGEVAEHKTSLVVQTLKIR